MKSEEYISLLESQKDELEKQFAQFENEMGGMKAKVANISAELHKLKDQKSSTDEEFDTVTIIPSQQNESNHITSVTDYLPKMGKFHPLSEINTGTLYLYAVGEVVNKDAHISKKLLVSIVGLLFACMQIFVIFVLYYEASHQRCNSMDDCPLGTYCTTRFFHLPACFDCKSVPTMTNNFTQCPSVFPEKWDNWDLIDIDHIEYRVQTYNETSSLFECVSFKHCEETDIDAHSQFKGHCDFITLNKAKMDKGSWIFVVFLAILWALPAVHDIEEATIEERVINLHINAAYSIPSEIMRMALRLRRFLLPFSMVSASVLLIITDDLTTKSIILDFMTITFVMEADNALALLFLRASQIDLIERTIKDINLEELENSKGIHFWARTQGLLCVMLMIIGLSLVEKYVNDCDNLDEFLLLLAVIPYVTASIVQGIHRCCTRKVKESMLKRLINGLINFFTNIVALLASLVFITLSLWFSFGIDGVYINVVKKNYIFYVIAPLVLVSLEWLNRRWLKDLDTTLCNVTT